MLKYRLVAALGLLASGCTDSVKRDFGPADPCARASTVFTLAGGGPGLRASLSSTTGPAGLTATMQGTTTVVTTTYTTGPLIYDGTLTGRNEFGQCEYKLTGTYPLSNTWYNDWKRYGFVNITPPTIPASSITIERVGQGSTTVSITPACTYDVEISWNDPNLGIGPTSPATTTANGTLTLTATSAGGGARTTPVTLTMTSSCSGTTPVTGTLTVTMQ